MTADPKPTSTEASGAHLALTLGFAGLIAGLALVAAYEFTLPTIEANRARALREAVKKVVPGSTKMQPLVAEGGALRLATDADKEGRIYAAYDDGGKFLGYAIPSQGAGFQDAIVLIYGFDPDGRKTMGMKILESRETPGLGDKIYKDKAFSRRFDSLAVEPPVVAVKDGANEPNEIDAITGATISSKAVVKIINKSHATWGALLPNAASAPALVEVDKKEAAPDADQDR